jgi:phosphohistidine phosphatase
MPMYLVRHGAATAIGDDMMRTLTPEGRRIVERVGGSLRERGVAVARLVSSPLPRAVQTAEILAALLQHRGAVETDARLLPDTPARVSLRLIGEIGDDALLVGHEPAISALTAALLERPSFAGFAKGQVVCLQTRPAALLWGLNPNELKPLALS